MEHSSQNELEQDAVTAADKTPAQKLPWQPPVIEQFDVATVTQAGGGLYTIADIATYSS